MNKKRRGQAELISAMILIGATLTIALAAYAYFASSAATASSKQMLQAILSREKSSLIFSLDYIKTINTTTEYYISFKKQAANNTPLLLAVVPGTIVSSDYVRIEGTLNARVEKLTPVDGVYQPVLLSPQLIPADMFESPPGKLYSFNPPDRVINVYTVHLTMATGEEIPGVLLKVSVDTSTSTSKPLILVLTGINNKYYIIDAYSLGGW